MGTRVTRWIDPAVDEFRPVDQPKVGKTMSFQKFCAKQSLYLGNEYPFDAPNAWWLGGGTDYPMPEAQDTAHMVARGVIWAVQLHVPGMNSARIEEATRVSLVNHIADIIRETTKGE